MATRANDQQKERFLEAHANGATVCDAARSAGVHRGTVYKWRERDPDFALAWREARDKFVQELEMEAYKRAIEGSDRLLIFLLRSYKPDTYSEKRKQEHGSIGVTIAELAERVRQWL